MTGGHEVATYPAVADGNPFHHKPAAPARLDLHYLRASGLAQARLQLAVLSGNRRRALEQIDRLVMIDKQLERVSEGLVAIAPPSEALDDELDRERLAIASEKLALTSGIELPRLEPAFGAGMAAALPADEPVEIIEEETLKSSLKTLLLGALGLLVLFLAIGGALTQL
jgi:hypothetical protein